MRRGQVSDEVEDVCRREENWREDLEELILDESNRITKISGAKIMRILCSVEK